MQLLTEFLLSKIETIRSIADKAIENPDVGQVEMWDIIWDMDKKAMELGDYIRQLDALLPAKTKARLAKLSAEKVTNKMQ